MEPLGPTPLGHLGERAPGRREGGSAGRLLHDGPDGLSDAELVGELLRAGDEDGAAAAVALLSHFGGVRGLLDASPHAVLATGAAEPRRVARLAAVAGLLERYHGEAVREREVFSGSEATRRFLRHRLSGREREVFGALLLDTRHRLIACEDIFFGSVDRAAVYPREVLRCCLRQNASAVILFHNHPSGVAEPSASDIALTRRLATLLREVDVALLDHVIVGDMEQVSLAERGLVGA